MKKIITVLAFGFLFFTKIQAQILPPDFLCVRGDTLFWDLPVNNCGPFNGYEVWVSQNVNGPYTLHATVTNQAQDFFAFINPSGQQWFFYLVSNYNCPGQTAIPSDTLDNRPPEVSPITSASVESGLAVVTWQPSPSPEVFAYVIYRQTPIGVIPIDTVFSGNTYTDLNSDPETASESYFVNALDRCGNTSIFDLKHTTIFLTAEVNPCRQSVSLGWNTYQNWPNGIDEQQIWVAENGGALVPMTDAGTSAASFEYENVIDGATYCFVLQAVEAATGNVAKSNQVCVTADIVQSVVGLYLQNVTVEPTGQVGVTWGWNTTAEVNEVLILGSSQNAGYQMVATFTPVPPPPLPAVNTVADNSGAADAGKFFYKIQTKDGCDTLALSNYGSTIFLTATSIPGNVNQLNWTAFDFQNSSVNSYTVYKISGGTESQFGTVSAAATSFDDSFDPTNLAEAQACYYVVADHTVTAPDGSAIEQESRSNTACVEQKVRILTPNAFAPEGFNQEFRPLIVLGDLTKYEMRIFDRYGQEVFVSTVPDEGWNGKKDGRDLAQGVYVYLINVTQASGKETEKRGTVLLLR